MYFQFLGLAAAKGKVLTISTTKFVGPFASEEKREAFLEECHEIVSRGRKNPHQIKFIPHERIPVNKPAQNPFEIADDGRVVPVRVLQWGATPPEAFLEFLRNL